MSTIVGKQSDYYYYHHQHTSKQAVYTLVDGSGKASSHKSTTEPSIISKHRVALQPVYVKKVNGVEQMVYNSNMMKLGEKYEIDWNGDHLILIKNDDGEIDIYKFYPDS